MVVLCHGIPALKVRLPALAKANAASDCRPCESAVGRDLPKRGRGVKAVSSRGRHPLVPVVPRGCETAAALRMHRHRATTAGSSKVRPLISPGHAAARIGRIAEAGLEHRELSRRCGSSPLSRLGCRFTRSPGTQQKCVACGCLFAAALRSRVTQKSRSIDGKSPMMWATGHPTILPL